MLNQIALLLAAVAQPATAPPPATAPAAPAQPAQQQPQQPSRYGSLWVKWGPTASAASAAEAAPPAGSGERTQAQAADLGNRVGEMVATGNCRGGEQLALDAGDLALARAVRDFCNEPAGK